MTYPTWLLALAFVIGSACTPAVDEPVDARRYSINGTELFVTRVGEGQPIIVIHGGPMLEHGYLLPHLRPLADSYELIFYDQRLSGRSSATVDSASVRLATFVDDIESLRLALELEDIHLLGHSWGGLLAMQYAIRYGQHLRSLVLLNSMSASAAQWREEEAAASRLVTDDDRRELQAIRETNAFRRSEPAAISAVLRASFRAQFHDRGKIRELELFVPADYSERSRQFGFMMDDLMSFDLRANLALVTTPTLIMYGDAEPGSDISGPTLDNVLPNATLVIVDSAGHFPFIEQPATTLDALRSFLRTVNGT